MNEPLRLDPDRFLHLTDTLDMHLVRAGPGYWQHRDRPELASGRLVSIFSYDTTWDYQERHPDGDELALVLEGEVELLLDAGDGERVVRIACGEALVIPAGEWHRAAVHSPSTVLFITPVPARTEHRGIIADPPNVAQQS